LLAVPRKVLLIRFEPVVNVDVDVQEQLFKATLIMEMVGYGNLTIPLISTLKSDGKRRDYNARPAIL
jgi:hypothetical protein